MNLTPLGATGLMVPPLCLGTMYFGTHLPAAQAHRLVDMAVDRGVTFLDTANNYAFWVDGGTGDESELALGGWLSARGPATRDKVTLATKIGGRPRAGGTSLDDALGLSASVVRPQVEDCLDRLGTDHVDLLYAHIDDQKVPLAETVAALGEVVEAGLAEAVGCSNISPERLREAVSMASAEGAVRYVAVQQRATYLTPAPGADFAPHVHLDEALEQAAAELEVTVLGYSPLAGGAYTRSDRPLPSQYVHAGTAAQLEALDAVTGVTGATRNQVVLAWMAQRDRPIVPVVGFSTSEQLGEAIGAIDLRLDDESLARLELPRRTLLET